MKEYKFTKGNKTYSLIADNVKYLCGSNYELKYLLMNILRQALSRSEASEFQVENNKEVSLEIDGCPIKKGTILFDVNQFYNLETELKLQSKSLLSKYYETYLNENLYFDIICSINNLFDSFKNQINEDDNILQSNFIEINNKQLIKMLTPIIIKDELQCNIYDFSYEELIVFQLKLITYIAENNPTQNYIVIIDIPNITANINKNIAKLNNLLFFVLIDKVYEVNEISDYCIFNSNIIDLADEQYIYESIVEQLPIYIELQEVYKLMELILKKEFNARTKFIMDIIE